MRDEEERSRRQGSDVTGGELAHARERASQRERELSERARINPRVDNGAERLLHLAPTLNFCCSKQRCVR
eukprot:3008239-Rhodomonas_salina.1